MSVQSDGASSSALRGQQSRKLDRSEKTSFQPIDWASLVTQIKAGDKTGREQLDKM